MKLEQTVDMMTSDDYKERFKAEYYQLTNRINKLKHIISDARKIGRKTVDKCPLDVLVWQYRTMLDYQYVLKRRAEIENIKL